MQYSLYTVAQGDNDALAEYNSFLRSHRILTVDRQWTGVAWAFCVAWQESASVGFSTPAGAGRGVPKIDYREKLSPEAFARFSRLREVRKKQAEKAAMPYYAVFTNEQLAAFVALPAPVKLSDLSKVNGVGEARIKKFGKEILEALNAQSGEAPPALESVATDNENPPQEEAA